MIWLLLFILVAGVGGLMMMAFSASGRSRRFAALGWLMKHATWPRAPALVGFVLSGAMEQYFWLANQIHGWSWLTRPGVLLIGSVIVIPLILSAVRWAEQPIMDVPAAAAKAIYLDPPSRTGSPAEAGSSLPVTRSA